MKPFTKKSRRRKDRRYRRLGIERLEDRRLLASDFGDAPLPYPTLTAENGASHVAGGALMLGAAVDSEADGTHSANADFDDLNGTTPDDEDGVTFGTTMVGVLGATVTVNVTGAAGKLDAWIDFNGDGSWGGPGEQIFASQNVVVGNNNLTFDVPSYAITGTTYARFRLSTAGALGTEGAAADGEVEDYQVTIANPAAASGVFGGQNTISTAANGARSVFAADVDGDGDLDVLSASPYDNKIAWYENDGGQNFTPHTISTAANGAIGVFAADVDGDGDLDVLSASLYDHKIAWYENDGSQNFTPHTISTSALNAQSVFAADVDGDGDLDVLSASSADDQIAWYENDGSQAFTPHTISTAANFARSVFAADVDTDGDLDVLSASASDDKIAWYENDGGQTFTPRTISTVADAAYSVFAADVDGDGDLDVLSASFSDAKIAWYENDGSEIFTPHTISTAANGAESVFATDVDGDGDLDVLSASRIDDKIAWYENDGSQNFTARTISTAANGARSVFAADVDGDGDLDVLSASTYDDKIAWYENFNSVDFGDAPAPYPTTLSENGAFHNAVGPTLGANRDSEADGDHSATANADDTTGSPDDEDGVTIGTMMVGALGATVTVNVTGAAGKLDAWIDFNGDGSWGGPGEQIFASQNVVVGNNNLTFDVPSYAITGTTYARFRLSTAGALGTEGAAADGEVEDYQVTIANPAAASGVFGGQNTISTAANGARSVFAADVDGDGDLDVLSASPYDNKIAWYENDGGQNFTPHTISTAANGAIGVFAADVDGDGDLDVLSASLYDHKIAWYENDGSQNFTPHTISTSALNAQSVFAADVDGDGDLDVLSASSADDQIAWYENDGSQAFTPHTISTAANFARSVFAADVDTDGDLDVLSASASDDKIAWYENDGGQTFTPRTISTVADAAYSVFAADVDGDGDLDVLSASFSDAKIAWYENDGSEIFTPHTISTAANGAESVFATDVDGDGDLDVLSASRIDDKIAWYENDGSQNFTARTISTAANGARSVFAADVDGDGDLDVLSASTYDDKIAWYENLNLDFGDAPTPYPTTRSENGARHEIAGLTLGTARDQEADGTHSAAANFDDLNGATPDDEDGVTFGTLMVGALGATVTVNVQGAVGKLDAWIDFNGDGSWGGPGEQIFASQNVGVGDNALTFDVPSFAIAGTTFARFRLSTVGALGPAGAAADGEVEDYQVTVANPSVASGNFIGPNTISTAADRAQSVFAADVDGDGDLDVLSASENDDTIAWYENDGQIFTEHIISTTAADARSVFAADVDGDGDLDVLSASYNDNKIAWYENDGTPAVGPWTEHAISMVAYGASSVFAADVDGDGDLDVLGTAIFNDEIAWYENDGSQSFTPHTVSFDVDAPVSVFAADVDGDGDLDVLSASYYDDNIAWYENDGTPAVGDWTARSISTTADDAYSVFAADVDGDGDIDALSASRSDDTIAWYENDGTPTVGAWTEHTISTLANGAHSVFAADVDGDGDLDVLSASANDDTIAWYDNDGTPTVGAWTEHTISTTADRAYSVFAADVDGDGDLDVLSASVVDDKIAWYENLDSDYGDAPLPYPTTAAENGPRHRAFGPALGAARDIESDGTHSAAADADDATGAPDDEDGVTFGTIMVGALGATVTVNVSGTAGKLDAWIDFNGDGSWGGPGEQIFASQNVIVGNNNLTFDVPSFALAGTAYARFRLSTAGGLGTQGAAADGEVEDYQVTVTNPAAAIGVFGGQNTISTAADGASSVFAADVDGDGDLDMLSASFGDDKIAWYENDGSQNFTAHTISTAGNSPSSVFAADVDGDGDLDVLSASYADNTIAWYENDGSQNFTPHTISTAANGASSVFAADVDGDGDLDVLSASGIDDKIAWYENDGSQNFTPHTISTAANGAQSVFAADVDGDGDLDVLSASFADDKIAWYENDGSQNFTPHTISTAADFALSVFAADVDGDGDLDVLSASLSDDKVAWYENDGSQNFAPHTISTAADSARSVFVADVDGDGDLDVLSASDGDDKIAWYENDGSQNFTAHTISTAADFALSVFAADVDGDGDLDVLSASFIDDKIAWYENLGPLDFGDAPAPYPTTLAENGAIHQATGLALGANRDAEANGTHSANATADDTTGAPDDEDGVTFGTIMVGALGATVTVNVSGTAGKLDAWIDFNGDGSWGGPGEQIFASQNVVVGNNNLTFDVPSDAIAGTTYARFRVSTAGALGMGGAAADGEVEDYAVTIANPAAASGLFSGPNTISTLEFYTSSMTTADMDGDADLDIVIASQADNAIVWHENDGSQNYTRRTISTAVSAPYSVATADVDGDGDLDVLSASLIDDKIAWYENDGSQNFTQRVITTSADGAESVFAADIDGDGDVDVLSASIWDDKIAWYENDGSQNFTPHTISTAGNFPYTVLAADLDGDGDMDVLGVEGSKIAWYENDGSQNFTEHTITTAVLGARSVITADVDGDGDLDVLSASANDDKIAWYENDGSQNFMPHTISSTADLARVVFAADMDGDGDLDVLSASFGDDKIAWYENDGSQNFSEHAISTTADGAQSVTAADVDGDGDLDVLSATLFDHTLAWYEHLDSDYGDAPAPYPTTDAEDGARHKAIGPTLGLTRDSDADGTHSANADTDGPDEDGVTFGTMMVGALGATVTINVQGAVGKLDAWIDFNGDGSWGGPGEQIFASQNVIVGDNNLTFDVPSFAIAGTTYARFRLSTAGALGTEGAAADGEVEDYAVTITPPDVASGVFGGQNVVNTPDPDSEPFNGINGNADGAQSVFAADMDGDGDLDLLSASRYDDKIAWYENDGSQNFTPHTITAVAYGAFSVFAADVDGDGDLDVLSASAFDNKIAWYENDGSQNFTPHTISTAPYGARSVFAADMDGDGDLDVLSASQSDNKIAWYENDGSQNFTAHTITAAASGARSVFAADMDGDGDLDVLSASRYDSRIAWYENDGSQNFTPHTITAGAPGAFSVFAADVDGDGDLDVLSASYGDDKIAWYENDGNQNFTEHTISTAADGARSVFAADVDGDGDLDVLSASAYSAQIAWYENDGSQNFTEHTISTAANRANSVLAADVDGDGDLDILSASVYDDKIAWYENFDEVEFGDAPTPYPTTLAENGAVHDASGPTLGSMRDSEVDGTHSANADADGADEDGVTFGTMMVGALGATVTINVQGAVGKLDAWIDFNGDGSWGGPGEQIFASQNVIVGDNNLTFDVPSFAIAGTTYARFRLSTAGALGTEGAAADGEVEDYAVTITPPDVASGVFGGQNVVNTPDPDSEPFNGINGNADGAQSVFAADMDGDGDLDLLSASRYDDKIAWYENDGSQNFTPHTITAVAYGAFSVFAADVDGDGDLDVLSASAFDNKIAWYENDGSQNFTPHTISTAPYGARSVFAADMDGDGDLDVLSASQSDNKIAWYENDGSQNFTAHTITAAASGARSVFAADMDGDGDLDVLSASRYDSRIAWYENDGSQNFTPHTITAGAPGAFSVFAADVDGDGDLDVLSASYGDDKIAWYENDGNQNFTEHTISTAADGARSVFAADVDGDGDLDVLSASAYSAQIAWYENDGSQNFTEHTISTAANRANSVLAADVDGDGDLDILSASVYDDKIAWYENLDSDYGDAPAPYPTTDAENGARHKAIGPTLGANRDPDADGTHSANADADDTTGAPDDEDGVTITSLLIPGSMTTVTVNSSGVGKLDAWVDFDDDGSWAHPGEQIFAGQLLAAGNNLLSFLVPAGATLGAQTFARFRVSTAGGLTPTGSAADGEVEDHAVEICGTMVTHTGDSGLGSLRVAIQCANGATGAQTITFNIPGAGPHVILPATALPTITNPVVIDGTSEPDFAGTPVVEIDGINAGVATTIDGLKISAGNSTVKGLAINRFGGDGLEITTLGGNTIQGNYVGIGTNGTTDKGNGQSGVRVTNTAGNTIGGAVAADGNVISGNATHGVFLFQGGASNNVVQNNRVGTNAAGTAGVGNSSNGVYIVDGPDNQVLDNTIAGNLDNGLVIENGGGAGTASGTIARGNEIGTNSAGTAAFANNGIGLFVINAANTTIGGAAAGQGNLVSGNGRSGIVIQGSPATGAVILGNTIGLAANGNTDLGNASYGVWLLDAPGATVGGAGVGESNVISGNNRNGVVVSGSTASATVVRNNLIGVDVTGLIGRGNSNVGVWLDNSPGATVESNVIANNGKQGVLLSGLSASGNVVRDNLIGTAANGTTPLGNTSFGVWLLDAPNNTIGGVNAADRNVIAKNGASGVAVTGVNAFGNVIQGNSIGTDAGGTINLGNTQRGIQILTNAHDNTIGGTAAGAGNTIAFNGGAGVWALIDAGVGNAVLGNSTFSNAGVGIDLGPGGATANDASDPDTGPNLRQNTPVMTVATRLANGDLEITFSVDSSVANAAYPLRVEFFLADADNQEGLTFLGFHNYAAPGAATPTFTPAIAIAAGQRLVATATDNNDNTSEFSASIIVAAALRAAGGENRDGNYGSYGSYDPCEVQQLTSARLAPTIDAALRLLAEQGLSADQLAALFSVEFVIADLPTDLLGLATDTTIVIDQTAAGHGWFIDPTPLDSEEFFLTNNTLTATGDSAAAGHMDLLTAVLHELGHLLGSDDHHSSDIDDLMYGELVTGLRRLAAG